MLVYIISNINKSQSFEWLVYEYKKTNYPVGFILLGPTDTDLYKYINEIDLPVVQISHNGKKSFIRTFFLTIRALYNMKATAIHCHLIDANIIGLSAAFLLRIKNRYYTRHHSDFHWNTSYRGVILDKLCNYLSTKIIAISKVVKEVLLVEGVPESKIRLIHHGFRFDLLKKVSDIEIDKIKNKYKIRSDNFVIGVISRFLELKGIQFIIPAFKRYLNEDPNAILILANAKGEYTDQIIKLLEQIPNENYILIEFENEVQALYKCFNVFVHVPIDEKCEAFGQIYIESLSLKIPSIFTISGIAGEFLDEKSAYIVDYCNHEQIYAGIKYCKENTSGMALRVDYGYDLVHNKFNFSNMYSKLIELYKE
jgi:glycosyltransferase involved in cell wall biosynthesis